MSDDGREGTFAEEDNFLPITVVLVLLIVIATIVIVFCILKSTLAIDLEAQEGHGQAQMTLRSRMADYVVSVGRYFNVGDSDAEVWDSDRPTGPMSIYGYVRSTPAAHQEANPAEYYTLTGNQSESS